MSIEFEGQDERKPDGSVSARCEKLNAVALVDRPAANAGGMFCELTQADAASLQQLPALDRLEQRVGPWDLFEIQPDSP
jgi:hypothetical protein